MQTPEDDLMSRSGCDEVSSECANCGHDDYMHYNGAYECLEEGCLCSAFEVLSNGDVLGQCHPEEI